MRQPWVTEDFRGLSKRKNKLYAKWKASPGNNLLKREYNRVNVQVLLLKKELKSTYFTGLLLEASNNLKNVWNYINQIITNTRHELHRKIAQLKTNEGIIDSPVEIAKVINEHFVSVGSKLVERLQEDGSVAQKRPHDSGLDISGS